MISGISWANNQSFRSNKTKATDGIDRITPIILVFYVVYAFNHHLVGDGINEIKHVLDCLDEFLCALIKRREHEMPVKVY